MVNIDEIMLFRSLDEIVTNINSICSGLGLTGNSNVEAILSTESERAAELINRNQEYIIGMTNVKTLRIEKGINKPNNSAVAATTFIYRTSKGYNPWESIAELIDIFIPIENFSEISEKEKLKLEKDIEKTQKALEGTEKKLGNKQFLEKAPAEVVEQAKAKQIELTEKISKLKESLDSLK